MTERRISLELLLAMAVALLLALALGSDRQPDDPYPTMWVKPTTHMMDSFRGTATAEAEKATPEPSADSGSNDMLQPGMKAEPPQSLWDWWEEQRLPDNWTSA